MFRLNFVTKSFAPGTKIAEVVRILRYYADELEAGQAEGGFKAGIADSIVKDSTGIVIGRLTITGKP